MLRACVKNVDRWFISIIKHSWLSSIYTGTAKYLTNQVLFVHGLCSIIEHLLDTNKQPLSPILNLFRVDLCTLSTISTNTNKLYKGFSL